MYFPALSAGYMVSALISDWINLLFVVTRMNTPKSEIRWEIGTNFYILCYPHTKEMKANRKQNRVELAASKTEWN